MRLTLLTVAAFALPLAAGAQEVDEATVAKIDEMLAGMECQMDPGDIEVEDGGGFALDDVMCADGQYDIDVDQNLEVTDRRKE